MDRVSFFCIPEVMTVAKDIVDNISKSIEKSEKEKTNAGFVSYILLGIITFIVSMGLLFVLIR